MVNRTVDALVLAGGRVSGDYASAIGTPVKALAVMDGVSSVRRVVDALRAAPGIGRVVVVGPDEVAPALPPDCPLQRETPTALGNILAGFERLGAAGTDQVLVCGADVPALASAAVQDLLDRALPQAELVLPVVRRERFEARFEGSRNVYVHLAEGAFTGGSQYLVQPGALLRNQELLEQLFRNRKSQLGMVATLGVGFIWRLLTRTLTIPELEKRASILTRSHCQALPDCHPELAYDIDTLADFEYAKRWIEREARG